MKLTPPTRYPSRLLPLTALFVVFIRGANIEGGNWCGCGKTKVMPVMHVGKSKKDGVA